MIRVALATLAALAALFVGAVTDAQGELLVHPAHVAKQPKKTAVVAHCFFTKKPTVNGLRVTAAGVCKAGKKVVKSRLVSLVTAFDAGPGTPQVCYSSKGGKAVRLSKPIDWLGKNVLVPATAKIVFVLKPAKGKGKKVVKRLTVITGNEQAQCGPAVLPDPSLICQGFGLFGPGYGKCGAPQTHKPGGVNWLTPPTINNGVVSAGRVASSKGPCVYSAGGPTGILPDGGTWGADNLACANGSSAFVYLMAVLLVTPAHQRCFYSASPVAYRSFIVPTDWSGTLYPLYQVEESGFGIESETAALQVQGSAPSTGTCPSGLALFSN